MSRDPKLYLEDIAEAGGKIQRFCGGMDEAAFLADDMAQDAVLRNLEVIGEAVKRLPAAWKDGAPEIPWRDIAGFRDVIAHAYFGVDLGLVWSIVLDDLDPLMGAVRALLVR
ncbi:MAG TPA: DUF86 domain-containing protein [Holophagaceae bacterium]|nr:DUF86 domain-containing protein [Holophagaceae bacterium]